MSIHHIISGVEHGLKITKKMKMFEKIEPVSAAEKNEKDINEKESNIQELPVDKTVQEKEYKVHGIDENRKVWKMYLYQ